MEIPEITSEFIFITFAASFFSSLFSSLAGGGAGLILLPILMFIGLPFINALAIHKIAVTFLGLGSGYRFLKEKLIDLKVFWWTTLTGVPFVLIGAWFATKVDGELMKPIIGLIILIMIIVTWIKKSVPKNSKANPLTFKRGLIGSLLIIPTGFYSGWAGSGSGLLTTFIYIYLFKYSQMRAIAMTLSTNGIFWNGSAAIILIFLGHVTWLLIPGMILGALGGSYLGAHTGIKVGNNVVRKLFLITCSIITLLLLKPFIENWLI